jgi:hypothetical protein
MPGALIFKHGPLAWNGVLAFWVPACTYFTWFTVMAIQVVRAIRAWQPANAEHLAAG